LNPAVSVGLMVGGRFKAAELAPYIIAQVVGGIAGAGMLYLIASGKADFKLADGFAANGYGEYSPGGYSLLAGFVAEFVLTFMFLLIILGATDKRAPQGFAPIAIGLGLTLIHLIGIPVTNLSVNPARSTGPALFVGGWARHSSGPRCQIRNPIIAIAIAFTRGFHTAGLQHGEIPELLFVECFATSKSELESQ